MRAKLLYATLTLALVACSRAHCTEGEMSSQHLGIRGLFTSPNPQSDAPDGGLLIARNVVIERHGIAEPRPGFRRVSSSALMAIRLLPMFGTYLRVNEDDTISWAETPTTPITEPLTTNRLKLFEERAAAAEARKNVYVASRTGVRVLRSATASGVLGRARLANFGNVPTIAVQSLADGSVLAQNRYANYQAILVRTDSNGLVQRSYSTGSLRVQNTNATTKDVTLRAYMSRFAAFNTDRGFDHQDVIELYRTRTSTVEPGEEYYLAATARITDDDWGNGYIDITDGTPDGSLGAALYVNDSREGIEGANHPPPLARDLQLFRRSLFFANTLSPKRIVLRLPHMPPNETGIGFSSFGITRTNGSAVITMASTSDLVVGMMLVDENMSSWSGTLPVVITSINSATQVTVNATWNGSTDGSPVTRQFVDTLNIGGIYWPIGFGLEVFLSSFNGVRSAALRVGQSGTLKAYVIGRHSQYSNAGLSLNVPTPVTLVIEEIARNSSSPIYIRATRGHLYTYRTATTQGRLPTDTASEDVQLEADTLPNGLFYSKPDEPESVPLAYFDRIGDDSEIMRIVAAEDTLWIFKRGDGLWRLTGTVAPNWYIKRYDSTIRLLAPSAATVIGDTVYAWTQAGVLAISETRGVRNISDPIRDMLDPAQRYFRDTESSSVWMASDPISGNVLLGHGEVGDADEDTTNIYCFNTRTGAWSTWDADGALLDLTHMTFAPEVPALIAANGMGDIIEQRVNPQPDSVFVSADFDHGVILDEIDGDLLTWSNSDGSNWEPQVGDAVISDGKWLIVTEIVDEDVVRVHAEGATLGFANVLSAFESEIVWLPKGSPATVKRWREASLLFDTATGVHSFTASFLTDRNDPGVSVPREMPEYIEPSVTALRPISQRVMVPRDAARSPVLMPGVKIKQAGAIWRLNGVGIVYDATTTRVSR